MPALGPYFAGPLGVLPDLDAILKRSRDNLSTKNGLCNFLENLGYFAQTNSEVVNDDFDGE